MLKVPAYLVKVSSLSDGGISLGFHTQELTKEDKVTAFDFHGKFGWLAFKENSISLEDLPKENAKDDDFKSPSVRLRAVIYLYGKKKGVLDEESQRFYEQEMERIINHYKNKLN